MAIEDSPSFVCDDIIEAVRLREGEPLVGGHPHSMTDWKQSTGEVISGPHETTISSQGPDCTKPRRTPTEAVRQKRASLRHGSMPYPTGPCPRWPGRA